MKNIISGFKLDRRGMFCLILLFSFFDFASTYFGLKLAVISEGDFITKTAIVSLGLEAGLMTVFLLIIAAMYLIIYSQWNWTLYGCRIIQWLCYVTLCLKIFFILNNSYCLTGAALSM